jgi:hypothetical protein
VNQREGRWATQSDELEKMQLITFWSKFLGDDDELVGLFLPYVYTAHKYVPPGLSNFGARSSGEA